MSLAEIQKALKRQADFEQMGVYVDAFPKYPAPLGFQREPDFKTSDTKKSNNYQNIVEVSEISSECDDHATVTPAAPAII